MAELLLIRHAQASYGAADYDNLSPEGHQQAKLLGEYLRGLGWQPDRIVTGTLRRQRQTLASMAGFGSGETHAGFNEYDFQDLLAARARSGAPAAYSEDRRAHFKLLRETVFDWQQDRLIGTSESWQDFTNRVEAARQFATRPGAKRVLVISSGGAIGQVVAASLGAPAAQMMHLNLQIKNTSISRFVFTQQAFSLHEFNATPHLDHPDQASLRTFS